MEKKVEICYNWKKNEIISLIKIYKSYPELWNVNNSKYKNRIKRRYAINNIADTLKKSSAEVNRKLTNLRTQLFNEKRKIERRKAVQGYDEQIQSSWEFFESLKFIDCDAEDTSPPMQPKQIKLDSVSNYNISEETCHSNINDNDNSLFAKGEILQNEVTEEEETLMIASPERTVTKPIRKANKWKIRKQTSNEVPDQDILLKNALYAMNNRLNDEHQVFGDYIASELRGLRSSHYRKLLKRTIQRAILKIGDMDDEHYVGDLSDSQ